MSARHVAWRLERAVDAFERRRPEWDSLNRATGNHVLLDAGFVALLLRHFGHPDVWLAASGDPARPAMALVEKGRSGFWQTFQPSQSPLGLILLGSRADVTGQIRALVRTLPGWAVGLGILHQDSDYTAFDRAASPLTEVVDYIRTARITFKGSFEEYWAARDRHFVRDLARRRRRLVEQGVRIELAVSRDAAQVAEGIRDYGRLETAGWKAHLGTAISADNAQGTFYREVLEYFCSRHEGVIYRLTFDGKTVASNLGLERDGMLVVLKTTYDETLQSSSPGRLLDEDMRRAIFAEGRIKVEEYYGPFNESQAKWTDEIRDIYHVNVYRSAGVRRAWDAFRSLRARIRRPSPAPGPAAR
jgi:hypothetical protein